ncbi:MAG: succinate dehydrogenase [Nitrosopumilaceae archaeon]|jgi:succinate dehydrogenase / fumarate reductase cytochrome b subunit|nr:succinate dehydrogenase [Nitrosopumilaceae archaeon]
MNKHQNNRAGIRAWLNPWRYGIERFAYWLMRITGIGLLIYFIIHIYETSSILEGKEIWNKMLDLTQTTEGHIILILVIGMATFHTINGIRIMLGHGGIGIGNASRPDYPYIPKSQNMKNKLCIYASVGLAALAMLYGAEVMFGE